MKATLLKSLFCLLSVCFALGFAARAAGVGTPTQSNASTGSKIEVENWVKPEPGWLYVLDAQPDPGGPGGRVRLIDPEAGKVMGSVRTGDNADFALSPDGSRLYVASIMEGDSSELAAIDTAAGAIVQRGTIEDREVANVLPSFSAMAVSGDGLALGILIDAPKSEDADSFLLATFDTQTGNFLRRTVHLGNCGPGRFISYPTAQQFDFLCPRTNRIRLIRADGESRELQNVDVVLPWERRVGTAEAIEAPGAQDIAIIRGDGVVFQMNVATHEFAETSAHPVLPNRVPPAAWPVSPDSSKLYLGTSRITPAPTTTVFIWITAGPQISTPMTRRRPNFMCSTPAPGGRSAPSRPRCPSGTP
jgi:hypothetical protein